MLISLGLLECWWEINFTSFYNLPTKLDFSHTIKTAWGLRLYKCRMVCRIETQNKTYHLLNGFAISLQFWASWKALFMSKNISEYRSRNSSISTLWKEELEIPYYSGKIAIPKEIVSLEVQKMATEYGNWIITCFKKSKTKKSKFKNGTEGTGSNVKSLRIFILSNQVILLFSYLWDYHFPVHIKNTQHSFYKGGAEELVFCH